MTTTMPDPHSSGDYAKSAEHGFISVQTRVIMFTIILQCIATIGTGMWVNSKLSTTPSDVYRKLDDLSQDVPQEIEELKHRLEGDGTYPQRLQKILDAIETNRQEFVKLREELELTPDGD